MVFIALSLSGILTTVFIFLFCLVFDSAACHDCYIKQNYFPDLDELKKSLRRIQVNNIQEKDSLL